MIMKIKEEDKDLNYWKKNCEDDYLHTPISVLRYITELESKVNNGVLDDVINWRFWDDNKNNRIIGFIIGTTLGIIIGACL